MGRRGSLFLPQNFVYNIVIMVFCLHTYKLGQKPQHKENSTISGKHHFHFEGEGFSIVEFEGFGMVDVIVFLIMQLKVVGLLNFELGCIWRIKISHKIGRVIYGLAFPEASIQNIVNCRFKNLLQFFLKRRVSGSNKKISPYSELTSSRSPCTVAFVCVPDLQVSVVARLPSLNRLDKIKKNLGVLGKPRILDHRLSVLVSLTLFIATPRNYTTEKMILQDSVKA